jgi:regulator of replication initiation timing
MSADTAALADVLMPGKEKLARDIFDMANEMNKKDQRIIELERENEGLRFHNEVLTERLNMLVSESVKKKESADSELNLYKEMVKLYEKIIQVMEAK